jgi:hypothetical protein
LIILHFWKWWSSKKIFEAQTLAEEELATGKAIGDGEDDKLDETQNNDEGNIDASNTSGSDIETGEQNAENEEEQQ